MTPKSKAITAAEYVDLADLRRAIRRFLRFSEEAALAAGIEPVQHQALLAIKGSREDVTIGALADHLCIRHHSAVGLVDRLREQGYVRRERDDADRRRVRLVLTARADRILESLSEAHRDELRRTAPELVELLRRLDGTEE